MQSPVIYKLATRGSKLALWQAHFAQEQLQTLGLKIEIKSITTSGDRWKNKPLSEIGGKGVFVKELEEALLAKEADIAVHSLKDLAAKTPKLFQLPCVFPRHPANDVIIFSPKWLAKLKDSSKGPWLAEDLRKLGSLVIGTGSVRRIALLKDASAQISTVPIRGNVDTRLAKLRENDWDAIILSQASIYRLPLAEDYPNFVLDASWFVPCAAQGVIALETLETSPLALHIQKLSCKITEKKVAIERGILANCGGDCNLPVGVHVTLVDGKIKCDIAVFSRNGKSLRLTVEEDQAKSAEQITKSIWELLEGRGVRTYL